MGAAEGRKLGGKATPLYVFFSLSDITALFLLSHFLFPLPAPLPPFLFPFRHFLIVIAVQQLVSTYPILSHHILTYLLTDLLLSPHRHQSRPSLRKRTRPPRRQLIILLPCFLPPSLDIFRLLHTLSIYPLPSRRHGGKYASTDTTDRLD